MKILNEYFFGEDATYSDMTYFYGSLAFGILVCLFIEFQVY